MNKIKVTLDVSKIDKSKIIERKYQDKDGNEVIVKEYRIEVVELKDPKFIKQGDNYVMKKTHFVVEEQSKEEREIKAPSKYVGEGFVFEKKESINAVAKEIEYPTSPLTSKGYDDEVINVDDIPF